MRCFIAVPVSAALAATLGKVPGPADGRVAAADLHLTLAFLGERRGDWARALWPSLAELAVATPPFTLTLPDAGPFPAPGGRFWAARVAPEAALTDLHERLWRVLATAGVERESRPFLPHVTLARLGRATRAAPVAGPWRMPVASLAFHESPLDGGGYRVLREWPLVGPRT
ncbi:RNA 2',3'-cyclic phosphodiesterase [Alloalcanivorax sp. C16-1]|uniref:RNA 2',3'-cyclic phosphodiesterase n=1 Tax=Alloalcanivorax sp. C16-1 TaxID=3390051 RepID=UPI0039706877